MVHTFFGTNAPLDNETSDGDLILGGFYTPTRSYPPPQKAIEDTDFEFKKIKEFYKSIFSNVAHSTDYGQSQVRYYCMKCGNEQRNSMS